ncbi:hypothetical protein DRQ09_04040, partial [candidate division KSB1 bacterium]
FILNKDKKTCLTGCRKFPSDALNALRFLSAQRSYPANDIPNDGYYKAFEYSRKHLYKKSIMNNNMDTWTSIGPINRGGRTIAIAVVPDNPDIIYAGAASGGLWRLTLKDEIGDYYKWEYIDTGFPVLGVNAIAINPTNSKIIYIGTGEVYGYDSSIGGLYIRTTRGSYGIGILKTTDGGNTWQKSLDWSYNQKRGVLVIKINPLNPDVIYAGTSDGTYKSIDAGKTWKKIHSSLMAVDIAINPVDTNIVYISCGNLGSPGSGIYRTTDSGKNWEKLSNGLPLSWTGKTLLSIYKKNPNIVYADVADRFKSIGLYRSINNGLSWAKLSRIDYARYQGWFSHYVRVNPEDNNKIICAGVECYYSNNGGISLKIVKGMHVDHHVYADHPTDPDVVYFGNDGGVYRTTDGGKTFKELNNEYITAQFYNGFASSTSNPELALGRMQDNRTAMFMGSPNWTTELIGGDGGYCAINTLDNKILYGSSQYLNIYRSTDGGLSWSKISGSFERKNVCFLAPYILSPSHPWIMYAGDNHIYKTEDMGSSWKVMNGGNPLNGNPVLSIGISSSNPDIVYATTVPDENRRAEVFKSTDGGIAWKNITGNLPDRYYVDIVVSPHNDRVVYLTLSGFGSSHLYRTEDGGKTWDDIDRGNLPDVPTSAVIVDPENYNHIYAGNDIGVYVSTDYGETWQEFKEGMPTAALVMDLSISPANRKIRAVTHGNGIYERSLLKTTSIENSKYGLGLKEYELFQNYPNPFNSNTKIDFIVAHHTFVTIKIYNALGQEIRTVVAQGYPAGRFSVTWDGKDNYGKSVTSGTYIGLMKTGDFMKSIKISLIR